MLREQVGPGNIPLDPVEAAQGTKKGGIGQQVPLTVKRSMFGGKEKQYNSQMRFHKKMEGNLDEKNERHLFCLS